MKHFGGHYHDNLSKNVKDCHFSVKIVNKKSLKIPECEKNNFYWVLHPKQATYEARKILQPYMKHFGGHYHTSFVRKHEKLSFLKKHDVQKKSLKIPEMQKIKFWWVFHHKWTLYEAQKIFGAICDIFGGVIITFIYRRYQFSKK